MFLSYDKIYAMYVPVMLMTSPMNLQAVVFLLLVFIFRLTIELGLSKQAFSSGFTSIPLWMYIAEIVPMLALVLLAYFLYKSIDDTACVGLLKFVIAVTILSYLLIAVHWTMESNLVGTPLMLQETGKGLIPRIIYAIGIGQLLILALGRLFGKEKALDSKKGLILKVVAMLSAWSSTVIIVSGKQGPLVALASIVGGAFLCYSFDFLLDTNLLELYFHSLWFFTFTFMYAILIAS